MGILLIREIWIVRKLRKIKIFKNVRIKEKRDIRKRVITNSIIWRRKKKVWRTNKIIIRKIWIKFENFTIKIGTKISNN